MAGVTVLVLAAGQGTRFTASGGQTHKLQALLAGKPVMQHVLDMVQTVGLSCHVVEPDGHTTAGMGDSIARGVRATSTAAGWLILPADMPLVQAQTLRAVAQALHTAAADGVVQPFYTGQAGHPVAFAAGCRDALLALSGEQGARTVVQAQRKLGKVQTLAVDDPGILYDVDTLEDLRQAAAWFERSMPS